MTDDAVRDEIAFIRRAIEEGRGFATRWGSDMLVWGVVIAIGNIGAYATVRGWWRIDPDWIWAACIAFGWLFSLRRLLSRIMTGPSPVVRPMVRALQMVWLGSGIFLTTLYVAATYAGELRQGWFGAVAAGTLGVAFFASASLANLAWMRWVAIGWWLGEIALFALRHQAECLPVMAALWLLLLALPGFVLMRERPAAAP